ncbi:hypothetical protein F4820DRAFT_99831 [Hypoxylon rubiginosum]|uniref:Uncharacterized protein n=1 Tax=Hypoxylon rubiginosum TaxID=110542 RepID=A0ACB9ZCV1_9PEZI|nr:hypothetical protein F4820DRAFT_99831 [Hypoxylon rubiginosum]
MNLRRILRPCIQVWLANQSLGWLWLVGILGESARGAAVRRADIPNGGWLGGGGVVWLVGGGWLGCGGANQKLLIYYVILPAALARTGCAASVINNVRNSRGQDKCRKPRTRN